MSRFRSLVLFACLISGCSAFYIPGISRHTYRDGDPIPLYTNKIASDESKLSFAYNELSFVCPNSPEGWGSKFPQGRSVGLNFGELLRGDRITISDYQLEMGKDVTCQELCTREVAPESVYWARILVTENYGVEWIVDNLPGSTTFVGKDEEAKIYAPGFRLGEVDKESGKIYLNKHVSLLMRYRKVREDPSRKLIVGFEVYTGGTADQKDDCQKPIELLIPEPSGTLKVKYTYSVYWKEDVTIEWSSRWERFYLDNVTGEIKVHWLAILNSVLIGLVLTGTVGVIMVRTLNKDIQRYNANGDEEGKRLRRLGADGADVGDGGDELDDTTGWKLVHGDVFRPPPYASFFAPIIGSGAQLLVVCMGLAVFSALGVLNPSYRGGFMSFGLFLFIFAGVFSGYFSTRLHLLLDHHSNAASDTTSTWLRNALCTAILLPSFYLSILLLTNFLVWSQSSSTALPFTTILALFLLWLFINLPLALFGAFLGKRRHTRNPTKIPGRVNLIPRQIPTAVPWYLTPIPSAMIAGLFPFLMIFIELRFVFRAMNSSSSYIMYGFVLLSMFISLFVTAETAMIVTYFLLCLEDYRWWWRSLGTGLGTAAWVAIYATYWYFAYLSFKGFVSAVVYFGYLLAICTGLGIVGGATGWLASWLFVRKIYAAIKTD
ncbi:hypothetical protein BGX38DRAFT_836182 [Terfezia claveryi]|nr:hypothetical protein BGX38DRAFT_836182 [Terfezia claveryi]